MGVKIIRINALDGVVNVRQEMKGAFFDVDVPAGPVAGGYLEKKLSYDDFITEIVAQAAAAAGAPTVQQVFDLLKAGDNIKIALDPQDGKIVITSTVPATPAVPRPDAPTNGRVDDQADTFAVDINPAYPALGDYEIYYPGSAGNQPATNGRADLVGNVLTIRKLSGPIDEEAIGVRVAASGNRPASAWLTNKRAFTGVVVVPGDTVKPDISLTVPTAGATLTIGQPVPLTATATDNVGVTGVVFTNGATGAALGTGVKNGNSYSVAYTPTTAGALTITATASDAAGNSQAASVSVTVQAAANQSPSVTINGSSSATAGTSQNYQSVASDSDGVVALVELLLMADASTLTNFSVIGSDDTSPYVVGWTPATAGTGYLRMRATDDKGAQSFSSVLPVTVQAAGGGSGKPKLFLGVGMCSIYAYGFTSSGQQIRQTSVDGTAASNRVGDYFFGRVLNSGAKLVVIADPGRSYNDWIQPDGTVLYDGYVADYQQKLNAAVAKYGSTYDITAFMGMGENGWDRRTHDQGIQDAVAAINLVKATGITKIVVMPTLNRVAGNATLDSAWPYPRCTDALDKYLSDNASSLGIVTPGFSASPDMGSDTWMTDNGGALVNDDPHPSPLGAKHLSRIMAAGAVAFNDVSLAPEANGPGATLSGANTGTTNNTLSYTATAAPSGSAISQVEFVRVTSATDKTVLSVLATDTTSPYAFSLTPTAAGTYYLAARATDATGQAGISDVLTLTVTAGNTGPAPVAFLTPNQYGEPTTTNQATSKVNIANFSAIFKENMALSGLGKKLVYVDSIAATALIFGLTEAYTDGAAGSEGNDWQKADSAIYVEAGNQIDTYQKGGKVSAIQGPGQGSPSFVKRNIYVERLAHPTDSTKTLVRFTADGISGQLGADIVVGVKPMFLSLYLSSGVTAHAYHVSGDQVANS